MGGDGGRWGECGVAKFIHTYIVSSGGWKGDPIQIRH